MSMNVKGPIDKEPKRFQYLVDGELQYSSDEEFEAIQFLDEDHDRLQALATAESVTIDTKVIDVERGLDKTCSHVTIHPATAKPAGRQKFTRNDRPKFAEAVALLEEARAFSTIYGKVQIDLAIKLLKEGA